MQCKIDCNGQMITYELVRKKVKNINLRIKPDGSVTVSANVRVSQAKIDAVIREKGDFILRALAKYAAERARCASVQYIDGEVLRILGNSVVLKVVEGKKEGITINGTEMRLTVQDKADVARKERLVNRFFLCECRKVFGSAVDSLYPKLEQYGIPRPEIKIRTMKSRWGSCAFLKGRITLNMSLIHTSRSFIEYVVLHELCHFVHPNHSKSFYELVESIMPDWRERKKATLISDERGKKHGGRTSYDVRNE